MRYPNSVSQTRVLAKGDGPVSERSSLFTQMNLRSLFWDCLMMTFAESALEGFEMSWASKPDSSKRFNQP